MYSYTAGAHKSIKGDHVFFVNDPERVGATFNYMLQSGVANDMFVMICGRVTPSQREIIRRRVIINAEKYKILFNWLIDNHPSYTDMKRSESCPQPVLLSGFENNINNTDTPDENMKETEESFEQEHMTFASSVEPTETTGPYRNESEFVFSVLKGKMPTLLFRNGNFVNGHKIDLTELFHLNFPFGWGGPDERRVTRVSEHEVLRHYSRIALPQMQQSQFLLVLCSIYQRLLSFKKSFLICNSKLNTRTLGDQLAMLSQNQVEEAVNHIVNGKETDNPVLKNPLFS